MNYTLAITSCARHDLLRQTIDSFLECVEQTPRQTIILEDGPEPMPEWMHRRRGNLGNLLWLNNNERMGQSYSIDRIYSEISNEYIFWCEDDWEFHESNFLRPSFEILEHQKEISMVAVRSDWNHPLVPDVRKFWIAEPYWAGVWGGTCWNPGLRRLSDFRRFGSYGRHVGYGVNGLGHEQTWSKLHLDHGYRIAALPKHCRHLGGGRSRAVEPLERKLPRILIAVPACKKFDYGRWESEQSPHYNPANKAYGVDIHVSGDNPRVEAVRDTWFRDAQGFKHHLDAKFFYGQPFEGELKPDEVVLPVPDDYAALPLKTQAICKWALDNGYDQVVKGDDDTYIWVDRLVREIMENPNVEYGGYEHCNVCTGGPSYTLRKRAMEAVVAAGQPDHWAEDCWVSMVMGRNNIRPTMLPNHHPGFSQHWFNIDKIPKDAVAIHAVKPEDMRELYRREHGN